MNFWFRTPASRPRPQTPRDLRGRACINYRWAGSGALYRWPFEKVGEAFEVAVEGPLRLNDTDLILAAALDGVGLTCLLESAVACHAATGRLVRVLEDWCQPFPCFLLYYPGRRQVSTALHALIDFFQVSNRS